jgi:hypothetical protein
VRTYNRRNRRHRIRTHDLNSHTLQRDSTERDKMIIDVDSDHILLYFAAKISARPTRLSGGEPRASRRLSTTAVRGTG